MLTYPAAVAGKKKENTLQVDRGDDICGHDSKLGTEEAGVGPSDATSGRVTGVVARAEAAA